MTKTGNVSNEKLVTSARQVSKTTVHLLCACGAKSDADSEKYKRFVATLIIIVFPSVTH